MSQYQQFLTTRQQNPSAIVFIADEKPPFSDKIKLRTFDQHTILVSDYCKLHPGQVNGHLTVDAGWADIELLEINNFEVIIVSPEVAHG